MIIVTGAAGFIGSCLVSRLNREGYNDLVLVDDFSKKEKDGNLAGKKFSAKVDRKDFISWLRENQRLVQFVFHLGARTDTTEFNKAIFDELNLNYSKDVWNTCVEFGIPLVYASSAATYGNEAVVRTRRKVQCELIHYSFVNRFSSELSRFLMASGMFQESLFRGST